MQKTTRHQHQRNLPSALKRLPLTAAIYLAMGGFVMAQTTPAPAPAPEDPAKEKTATLAAVTVTAQKRTENLQKVPISIQVLGSQKLEEMNVTNFDDYAKLLPAVSFDRGEGGGSVPYMRGVASGENNNHSGPQPSVGVYLDEQPVTTIGGLLDLHIYDIERVEALAGPQGTLYGASSQAGTLRIITKKPDASGFSAGYSLEANSVSHGGMGSLVEGFINVPLSETAAIRVVGWDRRDAGYIDNVPGSRTYIGWDTLSDGEGTIDNSAVAEKDYNDVHVTGARASLKLDLGENWTVTPQIMSQKKTADGNFAMDPDVGDLQIRKFFPESFEDKFTQVALTVQGKIGNFDLTYAYTDLNRDTEAESDYSDYSYWYDAYYHDYYTSQGYTNYFGEYFRDDNGNYIDPSQKTLSKGGFGKTSHEIRISSPQENRFRFVAGYFWQKQTHKILENYVTNGDLSTEVAVTYWDNSLWLTNQFRQDKDEAWFGEASFDITDKLTATAGMRFFKYQNSLKGFYGFGPNSIGSSGEKQCFSAERFQGGPCLNLDTEVSKEDHLGRVNLTYQINDSKMVYVTWSEGFRPGGVNRLRVPGVGGTYEPDFLTNYEFGWKTSWDDNRVTFNGAIFQEEWDKMQFSFIPPFQNGLTVIRNAGAARIRGLEMDLNWAVNYNFTLTGGVAFYDAELTEDFCGFNDAAGQPATICIPGSIDPDNPNDEGDGPAAPKGTRLPVSAKFKGNVTGRYNFDIGGMEAYFQGSLMHEGSREAYLEAADVAIYGGLAGYTLLDLSAGIKKNNWSLDFYVKNATDERAELGRYSQCDVCAVSTWDPAYPNGQKYLITNTPRMFGIRFSQEF
jgi:iron complex outermembrane receptor protein